MRTAILSMTLGATVLSGASYLAYRSRAIKNVMNRMPTSKTVSDLMTVNPACCLKTTALQDVAKMMVEFDCGEIPVVDSYENNRPIGVVTDRDIVARILSQGINPLMMTAESCMSVPVVSIKPTTDVQEAVSLMEKNKVRRLPVVDKYGRLCGIISQADVARSMMQGRRSASLMSKISEPSERSSEVSQ